MCNKTEAAVGLSISLTGRFRPQGQQALQGFRVWQSYINAQGGIAVRNGEKRPVRLIWYDDYSQISFARMNVFQLLREDKIDVLLGPYSSSLTMAVVEIAEEHKKVVWNYGGSSDEIFSHGRRYLVGITSPASDYLRALPHWLAEESPVGFWNPPLVWPTTRCISSPSTFPGTITTSSLVSCSASVRRLWCWQGAFKTSWPSCEHAIVGPVPYARWRRLLPASVIFLLNLGRYRMESSGRASGSLE